MITFHGAPRTRATERNLGESVSNLQFTFLSTPVNRFYSPPDSDNVAGGGGYIPNQNAIADLNHPFTTLIQTSTHSSSSDRLQLPPEDSWATSTSDEYVDDAPYIPPSLHSDGHLTNQLPSDDYRPSPRPPNEFQLDSIFYEHPQYPVINKSVSPGESERSVDSGSQRSSNSHASSFQSSGDSDAYFHHNYDPSQHSYQQSSLYPAYDQHQQRIGLEHTRHDAQEYVPSGQSHYRPQTHTYGATESQVQFSQSSHRAASSAPSVPKASHGKSTQHVSGTSGTYSQPHRPVPPMHSYQVPIAEIPDPEPNLRQMLGMGPDKEISLAVLDDPPDGEKPNYPYPTLAKLAIHGSERKRLTLQEIYTALEDRFEWFRERSTADTAWKRSIRHLLSLNKTFRKVPRPVTDPGKGSYWIVDYSQGEGNKRVRKRNKKPTKTQLARQAAGIEQAHQGRSHSVESVLPVAGETDDSLIDPVLHDQGHRVGSQRPTPRRRATANLPYPTQISSSGNSKSPDDHSFTAHSASNVSALREGSNPQLGLSVAHSQPAFGHSSFGVVSATRSTHAQQTLDNTGNISQSSSGNLSSTESVQPPAASVAGFSVYQDSASSFLQGRTLPVPSKGGRAAASARSSQNFSNITLAPIRPVSHPSD